MREPSLMQPVDASRIGHGVLGVLVLLLVLAFPETGRTQAYPSKPIRLVVPYPPGGGLDIFARTVAPALGGQLGQPVVIENRPGASGVIGADVVAKSPADGYTILVAFGSQYLQPFVSKHVPYDTRRDFTPIVGIARAANIVVSHPSLPVTSMSELVAYARSRPGQIAYVTSGPGSSQHLSALLLEMSANIKLLHVSYKGGGPALNDLVGGQVQVGILVLSTVWPQVKSGRIRALAVVEATRSKSAPEVPTIGEVAVPGYATPDLWLGFLGPRGLPSAIVNRLNEEITIVAHSPDITPKLEATGYELTRSTAAQFSEQIDRSLEAYARITAAAGIKPE